MVINTINNVSNRGSVDNNRRITAASRAEKPPMVARNAATYENDAKAINPKDQQDFVERRKYPDRRKESKRPMVDTRRASDRRRTSRLDVEV